MQVTGFGVYCLVRVLLPFMTKNILLKVGLLFVSVVATLAVLEMGLRIFGEEETSSLIAFTGREKIRAPFPGIRYLYPGHAAYTQSWPSNPRGYYDHETQGLRYRVNNYGFRGDDFSLVRNESIRIAFIGDSFCWGIGVREADSLASLIERQLNERRPLDQSYEVYNFCLPGSSTAEEAALYQYVGRYFRPDLLVVWYFLNDVNQPPNLYIQGRSIRNEAPSNSRFYDLLLSRIDRFQRVNELHEQVDRAYQDEHPGLIGVEQALSRLRLLTDEEGVPRLLAIIPWMFRLEPGNYPFRAAHRAVTLRADREGFAVLDLLQFFEVSRAKDYWVHPVDHHANEIGHAIMAKAMLDFLEARLLEMGDDLIAAKKRRSEIPPINLENSPSREWYRSFIALSQKDN